MLLALDPARNSTLKAFPKATGSCASSRRVEDGSGALPSQSHAELTSPPRLAACARFALLRATEAQRTLSEPCGGHRPVRAHRPHAHPHLRPPGPVVGQ